MFRRSLVLDQAPSRTGYTVVEDDPRYSIFPGFPGRLLDHGRILLPEGDISDKLMVLKADLNELHREFRLREIVLEETRHIRRDPRSDSLLGAVFSECQDFGKRNGLDIYTQHPGTIKRVITGHGNASKEEVIEAVCQYYRFPRHKILDDNHADSLAAAFVWLYQGDEIRMAQNGKGGRKR